MSTLERSIRASRSSSDVSASPYCSRPSFRLCASDSSLLKYVDASNSGRNTPSMSGATPGAWLAWQWMSTTGVIASSQAALQRQLADALAGEVEHRVRDRRSDRHDARLARARRWILLCAHKRHADRGRLVDARHAVAREATV